MKMTAKKITILFYVFSALFAGGLGFVMGTYSNYLRSAGLDEFWVNMVNVSYYITITIFEIPTGIFADVFGRKWSFTFSCFILGLSCLIYGFSNSFIGFVAAEVIGAVGKTFASGAFEAWLVDSLKDTNECFDLGSVMSKAAWISRVSVIIASCIGGIAADRSMNYSFFLGGGIYLMTGILAVMFIKDHTFERITHSFKSGLKEMQITGRRSIEFMKIDTNFRFVLGIGLIQTLAFMAPNMEWQKIFTSIGGKNSTNGFIGGMIQFSLVLGSLFAMKLRLLIRDEKKQIIFVQICIGLAIALTVSAQNMFLVSLIFIVHEFGRGIMGPLLDTFLHNSIPSKERATLASFSSMTDHLGGVIGLISSGLIAKYFGIRSAWIVAGSIMILATTLIAKNGCDKKS